MRKRTVEVFSAGCPSCDEAAQVEARRYGVNRVTAVVVDGRLADCCLQGPVDAGTLRSLGVGTP